MYVFMSAEEQIQHGEDVTFGCISHSRDIDNKRECVVNGGDIWKL
jgi:hypothetical protein